MLLVGKKFDEEKVKLYNLQRGICPLCGRELNEDIKSNHLDHDHALAGSNAGRVRALLCVYCNALEGQIKHKFDSSGLRSKDVDIAVWLGQLAQYYSKDYSENSLHPVYVNDMAKAFNRLNKPEMVDELNRVNCVFPEKATKEKLSSLYKKALRKFLKGDK